MTTFGAFVEVAPKRDGLLHVSEWDVGRTANIADVVKEGDVVDVMVLEVAEGTGKIRLSRKAVLKLDGKIPDSEDDSGSVSGGDSHKDARDGPGTPRDGGERRGGGGRGTNGNGRRNKAPALKICITGDGDQR